jgi:NAD(P)-dependent dehydrogenase (short-subunit alcohol dehydrogenase family)
VDLRDEQAVHQALADVVAWRGRLDVVVNAAGVLHRSGPADTDVETWARVLDINLTGAFRVCQAALPHPDQRRRLHRSRAGATRL